MTHEEMMQLIAHYEIEQLHNVATAIRYQKGQIDAKEPSVEMLALAAQIIQNRQLTRIANYLEPER